MSSKKLSSKVINAAELLNLKLDRDPGIFYKNRIKPLFTSPATDNTGKKIVFRIGLSEVYNKNILREIEIYKNAKHLNLNFFPELIDHGENDGNNWLTYQYIEGETAGNTYLFNKKIDYLKILDFLEGMKHLGKILPKKLFSRSSKEKYLELINIIEKKDNRLAGKYKSEIKRVKKSAKDWSYDSFVHGDFHPQNIFINNKGIKVIDWESAHYNLSPFDYSFVWIRSYNAEIRNKIMGILSKLSISKDQINFVFSVNIMRDLFEWQKIISGDNEFVKLNDIDKEFRIQEIVADLEENFKIFTDKLEEYEN